MPQEKDHWARVSESTKSRFRRAQDAVLRKLPQLAGQDPRSVFAREQWRETLLPQDVIGFPTMMMHDERRFLYWLGKRYYAHAGAIVDGGTFLGGSFYPLAAGVRDQRLRQDIRRIQCYDTFIADKYMLGVFPEYLQGVSPGDSILEQFLGLTREYADYREVHIGDMAAKQWEGGPIEILFLDVLKSWKTNDNVVEWFFPSMIPGRGVIVQQDYIQEWCPWIHITMELLADYVELVDIVATSAVFLVTKDIPYDAVKRCNESAISPADQRALLQKVVRRFRGTQRGVLECCEARLLELHGQRMEAETMLLDIRRRFSTNAHVTWCANAVLRFMHGGDVFVVESRND